jgi:hypothetical protein
MRQGSRVSKIGLLPDGGPSVDEPPESLRIAAISTDIRLFALNWGVT